jgi:DNA-binding transcriptional regulator YdaS (Cro superfamily)
MDYEITDRDRALRRAINIVGSVAELARKLGLQRQAVSAWRRVPPERVLAVSLATEGKITCHELRPDLFPK